MQRALRSQVALLFVLLAVPLVAPTAADEPELVSVSTFYLVRHAEKAGTTGDVPLREEGHERARDLRDVLADVPLDAIYSTDLARTRQTAGPTVEDRGLALSFYSTDPSVPVETWAKELVRAHPGESVLVVGHSGGLQHPYSLVSIIRALTGETLPYMPETAYDDLFVVTVRAIEEDGETRLDGSLEHRHYGVPTPAD